MKIEDLLMERDDRKESHIHDSDDSDDSSSDSSSSDSDDNNGDEHTDDKSSKPEDNDGSDIGLDDNQGDGNKQLVVSEHMEDIYKPIVIVYAEVFPVKDTYTFEELKVNEDVFRGVQSSFLWSERTISKHVLSNG